jgi:hypothetical protein
VAQLDAMMREAGGYVDNKYSTDVVSPPPPPLLCMSINRGDIENKYSIDVDADSSSSSSACLSDELLRTSTRPNVESPPPPPHVCMSFHIEGKPCFDRFECLLSMTLLRGGPRDRRAATGGGRGGSAAGYVPGGAAPPPARGPPRAGQRQGLTLLHFEADPEPCFVTEPHRNPNASHKDSSRHAKKWTSVHSSTSRLSLSRFCH